MRLSSVLMSALVVVLGFAMRSDAQLESFLGSLNVEARADLPGVSARMSAQFGVPVQQGEVVLGSVASPADAFMCFQLGMLTHQPPEIIVTRYKKHKGKGWGAMAQDMGIKPGSAEFHALKRGDYVLAGGHDKAKFKMESNGHEGKGKGKKK